MSDKERHQKAERLVELVRECNILADELGLDACEVKYQISENGYGHQMLDVDIVKYLASTS